MRPFLIFSLAAHVLGAGCRPLGADDSTNWGTDFGSGDYQPGPGTDLSGAATNPDGSLEPLCLGISCEGHGTCVVRDGHAQCHCDSGYANQISVTTCVPVAGTDCAGVDCGAGTCLIGAPPVGLLSCQCDPGFVTYGTACVPERRIFCRTTDGKLASRGTTRCGANGSSLDVCRDADGDGLVEWAFGVDCAGGTTCANGCLNAACPNQPCPIGTACVTEAHGMPLGVCVPTCDCTNCGNCAAQNFSGGAQQLTCGGMNPPQKACNSPCPNPSDGCIPYDPPICWPLEGCLSGPPF